MVASLTLSQFVQAQDVPRITKEELKKKLCSKNLMLIDVRVIQGWEQSNQKIKCATHMDPDNVSIWASTLPKDKEIVFYCS
jgi:rhodanese-related sulfurtransferase